MESIKTINKLPIKKTYMLGSNVARTKLWLQCRGGRSWGHVQPCDWDGRDQGMQLLELEGRSSGPTYHRGSCCCVLEARG